MGFLFSLLRKISVIDSDEWTCYRYRKIKKNIIEKKFPNIYVLRYDFVPS